MAYVPYPAGASLRRVLAAHTGSASARILEFVPSAGSEGSVPGTGRQEGGSNVPPAARIYPPFCSSVAGPAHILYYSTMY